MSSTTMDPWELLEAVKKRTEYFQKKHAETKQSLMDSYLEEMMAPQWSWLKFKHVTPEQPTEREVIKYAGKFSWNDEFTVNNAMLKRRMEENDTLRALAEIAIRANQLVTITDDHSFIQKYLDPK